MNRTEKDQAVSTLNAGIGQATNAFLIEFKGVTVPQVTELRQKVRESGSQYVVVKNTLALIAVKDTPMSGLSKHFSGPTAVAYNTTDAVALAKALTKFAKDVPTVKFKAALLNGQVVAADQIEAIANLPTREQLVSKLLFVLQSPIRSLAIVLNANIRNLAVVLDQVAKQRAEGAPASEPAAQAAPAEQSAAPEQAAAPAESTSASEPTEPAGDPTVAS